MGYCLVDKIDAEVQSRVVQIALSLAHEHGLKVHTITCDCTNVNPKMMNLVGCRWLDNDGDGANLAIVLMTCSAHSTARTLVARICT